MRNEVVSPVTTDGERYFAGLVGAGVGTSPSPRAAALDAVHTVAFAEGETTGRNASSSGSGAAFARGLSFIPIASLRGGAR